MKLKTIIYLSITFFLFGCEDYLDRQGNNTEMLTEQQVFSDPERLMLYADRLYDCANSWTFEGRWNLRNGTGNMGEGKNYASVTQISGEVVSFRELATMKDALAGNYLNLCRPSSYADPEHEYSWESSWEGILIANLLIDKFNNGEVTCLNDEEYKRTLGTAYAMRAYCYSEIVKRWGEVPYFKDRMTAATEYDVQQSPYDSIVNWMVKDCDIAAELIPEVSYLGDELHMGRIGKASALAVKSRLLTTAASPLNNPYFEGRSTKGVYEVEKWERAASAAWDVIKMSQENPDKIGLYKINNDPEFDPNFYEGRYNNIFWGQIGTVEDLWPRYNEEADFNVYHILWQWSANGGCTSALGSGPTLEYVDMYETNKGYPINHSNSNYTDDHPFKDRDPRFETNLIHHGTIWNTYTEGDTINMMTAPELGEDRAQVSGPDYGNSKTGYLVKKVLPEDQNPSFPNKMYINAPYIRMAEMYLNYAEAVNEAWGPQGKAPGASMTAVQALNEVRNRVGHVDVPAEFTVDIDAFRKVVRNEFMVELMFEYHALHDMMRWMTAKDFLHGRNFHAMLLTQDESKPEGIRYERSEMNIKRVFTDRQYRYPFFNDDMLTFKNLNQNPGW